MEEVKKQGMESLFVPYEIALALKELGFDEECFAGYDIDTTELYIGYENDQKTFNIEYYILAPLYQQAFRWLYQKLDIEKGVMPLDIESQQLLLKELIDKVSSKHLIEIVKDEITRKNT